MDTPNSGEAGRLILGTINVRLKRCINSISMRFSKVVKRRRTLTKTTLMSIWRRFKEKIRLEKNVIVPPRKWLVELR